MSEETEVVCLTNPFKPIQPGIVKMERTDDIQVIFKIFLKRGWAMIAHERPTSGV